MPKAAKSRPQPAMSHLSRSPSTFPLAEHLTGTTAPVRPRMKEARPSWRIADRGRHLLARERLRHLNAVGKPLASGYRQHGQLPGQIRVDEVIMGLQGPQASIPGHLAQLQRAGGG